MSFPRENYAERPERTSSPYKDIQKGLNSVAAAPGEVRQMVSKIVLAFDQIETQTSLLCDKLLPITAVRETGASPAVPTPAAPWERDFPLATEVGQELDALLNLELRLIARLQSLRESISL